MYGRKWVVGSILSCVMSLALCQAPGGEQAAQAAPEARTGRESLAGAASAQRPDDAQPTSAPTETSLPLVTDSISEFPGTGNIEKVPRPFPKIQIILMGLVVGAVISLLGSGLLWLRIPVQFITVTALSRLMLTAIVFACVPGVGPGTNPHIGWLNLGVWVLSGLLGLLAGRRLWRQERKKGR